MKFQVIEMKAEDQIDGECLEIYMPVKELIIRFDSKEEGEEWLDHVAIYGGAPEMVKPKVEAVAWVEVCMQWHKRVLVGDKRHYCMCWDEWPMDETMHEFKTCECFDDGPHCYQCGKAVGYLFGDSRCKDCTRLIPKEVRGECDIANDHYCDHIWVERGDERSSNFSVRCSKCHADGLI